ncbi:hypothetical protein J6590_085515 [Homalodisca vitripennis]|nr:hypothetical protein J6590_085515 [Homalodisca vitripennis]
MLEWVGMNPPSLPILNIPALQKPCRGNGRFWSGGAESSIRTHPEYSGSPEAIQMHVLMRTFFKRALAKYLGTNGFVHMQKRVLNQRRQNSTLVVFTSTVAFAARFELLDWALEPTYVFRRARFFARFTWCHLCVLYTMGAEAFETELFIGELE